MATIKTEHVFDHPIEKQREYAARFGLSLEEWRELMIESDRRAAAFSAELDANEGIPPDDLTDEEIQNLQDKIDSGNPLPKGSRRQ